VIVPPGEEVVILFAVTATEPLLHIEPRTPLLPTPAGNQNSGTAFERCRLNTRIKLTFTNRRLRVARTNAERKRNGGVVFNREPRMDANMRPKGINDYGLDDFSRDFDKLIGTDSLNDGPRVKAVVFDVSQVNVFNRPNSKCARTQRLGISRFPKRLRGGYSEAKRKSIVFFGSFFGSFFGLELRLMQNRLRLWPPIDLAPFRLRPSLVDTSCDYWTMSTFKNPAPGDSKRAVYVSFCLVELNRNKCVPDNYSTRPLRIR
jgi:hypothetical protein